jgi:Flp pilus assembly protein TadG
MSSPSHRRAKRRRGTAIVELAVCLPTLVLLLLASIESCNMLFLDHALHVAAYEGARVASAPNSTSAAALTRCETLLAARGVTGATITIEPSNVAAAPRGQWITVRVEAPCDANSLSPAMFFQGKTLAGQCVMVKE